MELDVVLVDICGVVLGSPYLYDRDAAFYRSEHKYHLKKEGVEFIVRAHKVKSNLDLIVSNQVKQFISSSKYVLMVIKEQHKVDCLRCEIQFIDQLVKVVNSFPRSLIHEQDKQHEIHLMSYEHLLQDRMNLNSFIQLNYRSYHHQQCIAGNGTCDSNQRLASSCMFIFSFRGAGQYWGKSVSHFFSIASSFHAFKSNETSLQVERKSISFHDKAFSKVDLKFPYHGLKTNAITKSVSQWKYQLIDIVIQVNQQLLRYFHNQTKLQQSLHHS